MSFYKKIIKQAYKYIQAANINSLTTILQQIYLRQNGLKDFNDIKENGLQRFNEFVTNKKNQIQQFVNSKINNQSYKSWIYEQIKNKTQQLQDIPKLIQQLEKLDKIKKYYNKLKQQKIELDRKEFDISNFKTYGDLNKFVNRYYSYITKDVLRNKLKNQQLPFPLLKTFGSYSLYKIGSLQQQQFQRIYGQQGWNTGWCVAQGTVQFDEYWDSYTPFYHLVTIKKQPIALISLSDLQFKDIHDNTFQKYNKDINDILQYLIDRYHIDLDDVDESELNDFSGYYLQKQFKDNKINPQFSDKTRKYNSITVYTRSEQGYNGEYNAFYLLQNNQLKMIINHYPSRDVQYCSELNQQFVDDLYKFLYNIFDDQIITWLRYNINCLKGFNLDKYIDIIINQKDFQSLVYILENNINISQQIQHEAVTKINQTADLYKNYTQNLLNKIYNTTKFKTIKQYIDSLILTEDTEKNLLKKLQQNVNSIDELEKIIDAISNKRITDNNKGIIYLIIEQLTHTNNITKKHQLIDKLLIKTSVKLIFDLTLFHDDEIKDYLLNNDDYFNELIQDYKSVDFLNRLNDEQLQKVFEKHNFLNQYCVVIFYNHVLYDGTKIKMLDHINEQQMMQILNFFRKCTWTVKLNNKIIDKLIQFKLIEKAIDKGFEFNHYQPINNVINCISFDNQLAWRDFLYHYHASKLTLDYIRQYLINNNQNKLLEYLKDLLN